MKSKSSAIILRLERELLDVTDRSLYSFGDQESMARFHKAAMAVALDEFISFADSDVAKFVIYAIEKVPHVKSFFDSLRGETELVAKLSKTAQEKLNDNEWRWVFAKDGSGMLPALQNESKHFAEQVRIGEKIIRPDMLDSLINLTQKNNLDALTEKIADLTVAVERIAAGQYSDRVAMFYSARQTYIEAMSMSDSESRRIALLNAAKSANDAISILQQSIYSDLKYLATPNNKKPGDLKRTTEAIATCFAKLNDSVQISINVHSALGETKAMLAAITSYRCFIEQSWLAKLTSGVYKGSSLAEIMQSSKDADGINWKQLPVEIVNTCEIIIQSDNETIELLEEAIQEELPEGQDDENL